MALTDYKITDTEIAANGIQAQPDKMTGTAAQNKVAFDGLVKNVVKVKINALIDALVTALTGKMDAPETEGMAGQYLKTDGAGNRSWDTPSGSGDMLKSVYDTDDDGVVDNAEACSGNAATATKWQTARSFSVSDGTASGTAQSVDGSGNVVLPLPSPLHASLVGNVSGNVNGNAATASNLAEGCTLPVGKGGTGATTAAAAREALGAASLTNGKVTPSEASSEAIGFNTDLTISSAHEGKFLTPYGTGSVTITIPASGITAYTEIEIFRRNDGDVTIVPASGVGLYGIGGNSSYKISDQYSGCALKMLSNSEWLITGNIEAAT